MKAASTLSHPSVVQRPRPISRAPRLKAPPTDTRILWFQVLAVTAFIAVSPFTGTTPLYVLLAAWALGSPRRSVEALTLSFLLTLINPVIVSGSDNSTTLRWVVFGVAVGSVLFTALYKRIPIPVSVRWVLLFGIVTVICSLATSYDIVISIAKIVTFTLGAITVIVGFRLAPFPAYWKSWFLTFFLTALYLSLPTYFLPHIGMARNNRGFQGILNQPQAFGIFLCPVVAWLTGMYALRENRSLPVTCGMAIGWVAVLLTLARTAVLAIVLGFFLALLMYAYHKRGLRELISRVFVSKHSVAFFIFGCFMFVGFVTVRWATIQNEVQEFLWKGKEDIALSQGFEQSRGFLIERSMTKFKKSPWFGNGFGLATDEERGITRRQDFTDITTSASVEKGFLPAAVLEEIGVIGAFMLLALVASLTLSVTKKGNFPAAWMFFTCLFVNVGETVFFSFGGVGLYMWLLVGATEILE